MMKIRLRKGDGLSSTWIGVDEKLYLLDTHINSYDRNEATKANACIMPTQVWATKYLGGVKRDDSNRST